MSDLALVQVRGHLHQCADDAGPEALRYDRLPCATTAQAARRGGSTVGLVPGQLNGTLLV
jgi:hypothetical protein